MQYNTHLTTFLHSDKRERTYIHGTRNVSKPVVWDTLGVMPYFARKIVSYMRSDLIWNCFYSGTLIKILCRLLKYCQFVTVQHNTAAKKKRFTTYSFSLLFFFPLLSYLLKRSCVQQRLLSKRRSCMTFFSSYWKPLHNLFFIWRFTTVSGIAGI